MNPWDTDPNLYLPLFRSLASRWRAWRRSRRASTMPVTAGCRG
jgi:hypothetical protein